MTLPLTFSGAAPLPALGVIRAQGADAAKFLHGQLTQDFSLLGLSEARLAAFCSPKGRMLASFVAAKRAHDDIVLVCRRDLLPATLKRLQMFVLRAQCKLSDASDAMALRGLVGAAVPAALPAPDWSQWRDREASVVRLPAADGVGRALWIAPLEGSPAPETTLDAAVWDWLSVRSGVATVGAAVADAFVPQMLNYESVGGVNFKKGCYPGQEVVARSQFRGTLKRRGVLLAASGPVAAGQEVFHAADAEQPCGLIAEAAPRPDGSGWAAIASLQTSALDGGALRAGDAALTPQPLPYPLRDDI